MSAHVTAVSRSGWFHLCQLTAVRHSVSAHAAKILISVIIISRLDGAFFTLSWNLPRRLYCRTACVAVIQVTV